MEDEKHNESPAMTFDLSLQRSNYPETIVICLALYEQSSTVPSHDSNHMQPFNAPVLTRPSESRFQLEACLPRSYRKQAGGM
jgi:hypothetical protein